MPGVLGESAGVRGGQAIVHDDAEARVSSHPVVTQRASPKNRTIRLNILRTYAVHWDAQTLVRDVVQNFFDASRDFAGVSIDIDRTQGIVRIDGPVPFALDYVKYIGGTTKSKGGFAGQFGEGFKVSALVALRDFGLRVLAGAGRWRIEPAFEKVRVGEELVYRHSQGVELPGSFLEFQRCSTELMDLFAEGRRFFRWEGNPSFGECLFSDGDVHVYRTTRKDGEVYYGKQLRGELWEMPFAFCLDLTLKRIRRDRDRRALATNQVRIVMVELGSHLPLGVGMTIVNELEHLWSNRRSPLMWLIVGLAGRHAQTYAEAWPTHFPDSWVAGETQKRWEHANAHARRLGYKVADSTLASVGMRRAREVWIQTVQLVAESELTALQRARRALLLDVAEILRPGPHPPLHLARMSGAQGEHGAGRILLGLSLLDGSLAAALGTYVHEICHEAGRDGDARFSDALTAALEKAVEAHDAIALYQQAWTALAKVDATALSEALEFEDPGVQVLLIFELSRAIPSPQPTRP